MRTIAPQNATNLTDEFMILFFMLIYKALFYEIIISFSLIFVNNITKNRLKLVYLMCMLGDWDIVGTAFY